MTEKALGRVVREGRGGHFAVEWLQPGAGGNTVAGFVLVGPFASASIIYATPAEALHALRDVEQRVMEKPPGDGAG